ncbi:MAG TPA: hypothetical protein VIR55_08695 [Ignavibacteria bacterium]
MKQVILIFFLTIFFFSISNSQINLAILFDNSASMKKLSGNGIEDTKKLIMDFIFEGRYDTSKWKFSGDKNSLKKIWVNYSTVYLHAFGKIISDKYPYFSEEPEIDIRSNEEFAKRFIKKYLLSKITLSESFTNDLLSELVCWKIFDTLNKNNFEINMIKVWDGLPDPEITPVQSLKMERTKYTPHEKQIILFQHKHYSNGKQSLSVEYKLCFYYKSKGIPTGTNNTNNTNNYNNTDTNLNDESDSKNNKILSLFLIIIVLLIFIGIIVYLKRKNYFPFNKRGNNNETNKEKSDSEINW